MTISSTNNSVFRGFSEKQKLTGPNFIDWYRQLRIVLSIEDKLNYLEQPIPPVPVAPAGQQVVPEILAAHTAWVKGSKEIAGLMLMTIESEIQRNQEPLHAHEMLKELKTLFAQQAEQELLQTTRDFHSCRQEEGQSVSSYVLKMKGYIDNLERLGHPVTLGLGVSLILIGLRKEYDDFVQNYNMHNMGKTVNELHAMLKLHEQTLPKSNAPALNAIRAGKVQKGNKHKKSHFQKGATGQNQGKGKFAPKPNIPHPPKRENPAKDSICHEYGEIGHWKRNCPQYLAELMKKKKNTTSGAGGSGIFVIKLNTILNRSWIYDTGCGTHICNTTQGLRDSRKLKPRALSLYVGNGQCEAVEAIGAFYLCLPSGLEIVLNNCHYAPSITRGVIFVFRLYEDGFVNQFVDNTIQVSRNNVVYFCAIPRDGIFEIDLSNSLINESSVYAVSNKRAKLDLDSALLWHCRLGHVSKKRIEKLQHDGLLNSSDLTTFEKCVSYYDITSSLRRRALQIDCKPVDTPMMVNQKLYIEKKAKLADKGRYQQIVGKLIYLSHTRPDIAYAVIVVSQFMHQPQISHMKAVLRIIRYLKGTPGHGVLFKANGHLETQVYTDANWAGDKENQRSTSGYFTLVGGNLVTWRRKKQKMVALSIQHDRTKHIEVDRHFIKEKLENGIIELPFVRSKDQLADILAKAVSNLEIIFGISQLELFFVYKDLIFESQGISTSNTHQQSLIEAGSETRPPMLERGSYIPWTSRSRIYLNRKRDNIKWLNKAIDEGPYEFRVFNPENEAPRMQTKDDLRGDDLKYYEADIEAMNLILISIPNGIYNSVDAYAFTTAKAMWQRVERLMRGTVVNKVDSEIRFNNEFDQFVAEPGEALVDVVQNNSEDPLTYAMMLLARAITQRFSSLTNNRLCTSSKTKNQAIVQGDRVNMQSKNSRHNGRNTRRSYVQEEVIKNDDGNIQRTLRTTSSRATANVQCYNHTKQDEAGVTLTGEQNDFLFADASRMEEIEELSANICLMARIQPANIDSDAGPSYDFAFLGEESQSQFIRDRDNIRDLEQQCDKLDLSVVELRRQNVELQKTQTFLKRKMSENEDKYHDTVLDLEAKLKKKIDVMLKIEIPRTFLMMLPIVKQK
nr:zinc finger, CCHC-type [Tanacetum cinerariifolium]